jgi:hypothetical protein
MAEFSKINIEMEKFEDGVKSEINFSPAKPWSPKQISDKAKNGRLKANADYWKYDHTYFAPELYTDGYAHESAFHRALINIAQKPGVHIVAAARAHGKTATMKKYVSWLLVEKGLNLSGAMSATLPQARNLLGDIAEIISMPKIKYDYGIEFDECNADQTTFKSLAKLTNVRIMTFSAGRSVKGTTKLFDRIRFILIDDLETRQSPLGEDQTNERIRAVTEAFQSMAPDGVVVWLANNYDEDCAVNKIKKMSEHGILYDGWNYYEFPAWSEKGYCTAGVRITKGALWKEKYPAKKEDELKLMLGVTDQSNWNGDFMQSPSPPEGDYFRREFFQTYCELPRDAAGIVYCDPNLSKKGKGDTTAIVALLYSPGEDRYYVADGRCLSFAGSNDLLDAVMEVRYKGYKLYAVAFDGNVSQESAWTNNIKNWCRINENPFTSVEYRKYNVDNLAKNCQRAYNSKQVYFNENFVNSPEGERFKRQLFAFTGKKKSNKADDAPDALICAFEFIVERGLARKSESVIKIPLLTNL